MNLLHSINRKSVTSIILLGCSIMWSFPLTGQNDKDIANEISQLEEDSVFQLNNLKTLKELSLGFKESNENLKYLWTQHLLQNLNMNSEKWNEAIFKNYHLSIDDLSKTEKFIYTDILFGNGVAYHRMEKVDSSIESHQKALDLRVKYLKEELEEISKSHSYLGYLYRYKRNDSEEALKHYLAQLSVLKKASDTSETLAKCHYNLSATYGLIEDYDLALTHAHKALELANRNNMPSYFLSYCFTSLANNHQLLSNYKRASQYYKQSIRIIEEQLGSEHPSLLILLNNLGVSFQEIKQSDSASYYFQKSTELAKLHYGDSHLEVANAYMLLALANLKENAGKDWVTKAISIYKNSPNTRQESLPLAYCRLSNWFINHKDYDSAVFYARRAFGDTSNYQRATPEIEDILSHNYRLIALRTLAEAKFLKVQFSASEPKDYQDALAYYIYLDSCKTFLQQRLSRETSKLRFFGRYREDYENALWLCYSLIHKFKKMEYNNLYWGFIEKNKASLLLESISRMQAKNQLGIPERIHNLQQELASSFEDIRLSLPSADLDQRVELQKQLLKLENQKDSLVKKLKIQHPSYYNYKFSHTISLKEVSQYVRENNTSFIQYFEGEKHVFSIKVSPTGVKSYMISKEALDSSLVPLIGLLNNGFNYASRQIDYEKYKQYGEDLYSLLVKPLINSGFEEYCIISPDGTLSYLPFETLLTSKDSSSIVNYSSLPYLLLKTNTAYAYSASTFLRTASLSKKDLKHLFAFTTTSSILPGSEKESSWIKEIWSETEEFKGENSSRYSFMEKASEADVLHFALHNIHNPRDPNQSGLLFNGMDSLLTTSDLYELDLSASLVFLSACESGLGKLEKGEGMYSLGRGFQYAGVPTVVMSLWKVSDASTPFLIKGFYKELRNKKSSIHSLNKSKQDFVNQSDKFQSHPSNWAAFIHIGQDQKQSPKWKSFLIFGPLILVMILIFMRLRKPS